MKRHNHPLLLLPILAAFAAITTLGTLSACSSDSDTTSTDTSGDCLISAATMGTLKRTIEVKKASGEDSTYTINVTGSLYPLSIDQSTNSIFNLDSLPKGTDMTKVVFSALTYPGEIGIRSLESGQDEAYTYSDSTDFSQPRAVTVWSADGTAKRTYTFDIRCHREEGDSVRWTTVQEANAQSPIAAFSESRTLIVDGTLYIYGQTASGGVQLVQTTTAAPSFSDATTLTAALNVRSVHRYADQFFALTTDGTLVASTTGADPWAPAGASLTFAALAGASADSLYAIATDGQLYATADGAAWTLSARDDDAALPTRGVTAALQTARVDAQSQHLVLGGTDARGAASVWMLNIDGSHRYAYPWMSIPQTEELGAYAYPAHLRHAWLLPYDEGTMLIGLEAQTDSVAPFYTSADNGRTWRPGVMKRPALAATALSAAVDPQTQHVWLVLGGTGAVLKGRINRLGWPDVQTAFTRGE